jgi:hypothetical protein
LLFDEWKLNPVIRFSNHPESTKWNIYDSVEQFNGEKLGSVKGYAFEYLYKENFPDSEIEYIIIIIMTVYIIYWEKKLKDF